MTLRLCFIGNSHLGALYKVWEVLHYKYPSVQIDFFIERGPATKPLIIRSEGAEDSVIHSLKVLHEDKVDVGLYDAFFVSSLEAGTVPVAELYKSYRTNKHIFTGDEYLVSDEVFSVAARGVIAETKAGEVLRTLRKHTKRPIHLLGQPRLNAYLLEATDNSLGSYKLSIGTKDEGSVERYYLEAVTDMCRSLGVGFVDQPAETVASPLLTKGEFGLADVADQSEGSYFAIGDFWHMNHKYGGAVLEQALSIVGCAVRKTSFGIHNGEVVLTDRLVDSGYAFNPRDEFGVTTEFCRLVIFDNNKGDFCYLKKIESAKTFVVSFEELPLDLNGKFKIQTEVGGKWADNVPYMWLPQSPNNRMV